jgi:hypothetical protein
VAAWFPSPSNFRTQWLAFSECECFGIIMSARIATLLDGPFAVPITITFEGDIPSEGLDADEVAAVADGMAKAIQFLVSRATDADRQYTLHLGEVRKGSAIFKFLLEGAAIAQTLLPFIPPGGFTIQQVTGILSQVIKLLDFLKGKPPTSTVTNDGNENVLVINSPGAQVTVNKIILQLAGNDYLQDKIAETLKPLKKPRRRVKLLEEEKKLLESSSEEYPEITAKPINDNNVLNSNTIDATLRVKQPHLDGENSWKFDWGRNRITAEIRDKSFMDKVRSRQEEFRSGDLLRVKLRIEEQQKGRNVMKKHYIEEIIGREREVN